MFHKRKKQVFPKGTFIPTLPRTLAIIQLCLAFSALLFTLSEPFMGQHFSIKSNLLVYEYVIGKNHPERSALFNALSQKQKESVQLGYDQLKNEASKSFVQKLKTSFELIFFKISLFERAWILFGIVCPILLLKKVEGANHAVWILPLITIAYFSFNNLNSDQNPIKSEDKLFPTESWLEKQYMNTPLSVFSVSEQQKELSKAWQTYLIEYFAKEIPSKNSSTFNSQAIKGEFYFQLKRLEWLPNKLSIENRLKSKPAPILMIGYLFWNIFFALVGSTGLSHSSYELKSPT